MAKTYAEKIIEFNRQLQYKGMLPEGFQLLNQFTEQQETWQAMSRFYQKYYNDHNQRKFIIGINPGRHGAGVTGVPFTDTKHLKNNCDIEMDVGATHEISSVFIYDMIAAYGSVRDFYAQFYINSPFPLAIIRQGPNGRWRNANYYDDRNLFQAVKPFMKASLCKQIELGLDTSEVFILGKKNLSFIQKINEEEALFEKLTVLPHPRFIQQYKLKEKENFIAEYLRVLGR